MDVTKKVCVLTGAGGLLGNAFCARFASVYHIAGVYRTHRPQAASQEETFFAPLDPYTELPQGDDCIFRVRADLTDDRDLERVVDVVLARYERVDVLINGAARMARVPMLDDERFFPELREQLELNAVVPAKLAMLIARRFWSARPRENARMNRSVVNVSSVASIRVYPGQQQAAYGASKAALNHLTAFMADEFRAFSVRANTLAPNTFPEIVDLDDVVEEIGRLAEDDRNGELVVLG